MFLWKNIFLIKLNCLTDRSVHRKQIAQQYCFLNSLESVDFDGEPVTIILSEDTPPEEQILIRLDYSDGIYNDWQFIQFKSTTPDYLDFGTSEISLTVAGNGNLGYATEIQDNGLGFQFDLNEIASQLGNLILNVDGAIIDNTISDFQVLSREQDLVTVKNIKFFSNSTADTYGDSFLDDSNAGSNEHGLFIEQKVLSWDESSDENYFILEYRISNNSVVDITDLKLALFIDWKINSNIENEIDWDATNKLGYAFQPSVQQIFGGSALLTTQTPIFYAIDKGSENGNTPDLGNTFSKTEKATLISSGMSKTQAGLNGGNDIAQLTGAEIGFINSGESTKVAFLVGATTNLPDLQAAVTQAQSRYSEFLNNPPVVMIDTTCLNQTATLNISSGQTFDFYSDAQAQNLIHSGNGFVTGILDRDTTFYIQNTDQIFKTDVRSLKVVPLEIDPEVTFPTEILLLGDNPNNTIQFEDHTLKAIDWLWDFDNGSGSTDDNPIAQFNEVGDYQISLMVTNKFGCVAQYSKMLSVRERGTTPTFTDYEICPGENLSIASIETNNLRIYATINSEPHVAEGTSFEPSPLFSDTTFYISNIDEEFESTRVAVPIHVIDLISDFRFQADSIDLTSVCMKTG